MEHDKSESTVKTLAQCFKTKFFLNITFVCEKQIKKLATF